MNPRKKQIIHAAHRLFVEKGFTSTSIQDILDEARISKGTFYNHFTSKNECLMAIIESVSEEADQQRREIALGKRRDDLEVFAAQIAVRMKVNREHNLVALFESVLYSKDEELKAFVKKQHMFEVQWTAERITEIFGPSSRRYALDQAVMLLGMIHHLMNIWLLGSKQEINSDRAIWFALDRLKPMMEDQIQSNEAFFPEDWLVLSTNWPEMNMAEMKERLIRLMEEFLEKAGNGELNAKQKETVEFLLSEFQSGKPRLFLLESLLHSMPNLFGQSALDHEARQLGQLAWHLLDLLEKRT